MKKRIFNVFLSLVVLFTTQLSSLNLIAVELDAVQFVTSVSLSTTTRPIGAAKVKDSSAIAADYSLDIGDGSTSDTSSVYTMPLPIEFTYTTSTPIQLLTTGGVNLGDVTIANNVISIQFMPAVSTLKNVKVAFNFWSNLNKAVLDYTNGNDLLFPTSTNPANTIHVNFSKSGSGGGGSGDSDVSKTLGYSRIDPTVVNWTITVNNGGYEVLDSIFEDTMENRQQYIPGSASFTYRNWKDKIIKTETADLELQQNTDGSQTFTKHFGYLTPDSASDDTEQHLFLFVIKQS